MSDPAPRLPILVDCDPGIDHVCTLFYAAHHFDLIQVTTVHGNAPLPVTTGNALRLVEFLGADVEVAAGCAAPLVEPPHSAELFHGDDGLGGAALPEPMRAPERRHAVEAIVETARAHQGRLVVACLGPLTNLAVAIRQEPRLTAWIRTICIMGGTHGMGQMTPAAEFNFWCDPEAAAIVCESGAAIRIIGYEVTRNIGFTEADLARLAGSGKRAAGLVARVFGFNIGRQRAAWGLDHAPIHSTLPLASLVRPECFAIRNAAMRVELTGTYTRAMSVYDLRTLKLTGTPPFEYLPPGTVELVVAADRAVVDHVAETILAFD